MIKKLWDRVIELLEKEYGLNYNTADIRFMYVIYLAYLNVDDLLLLRKSTTLIKRAYVEFHKQFKELEKISFSGFQRSIYRSIEKFNKNTDVDVARLIKEIVDKVQI